MVESFKIAGLGEVLWDAFPEGEKFGGAPANFACHCHSLGAETYVISCVGNDERGVKARAFLDNHGVNTSGLTTSDEQETGVVLVTLDANGRPDYEIKEGVAWDYVPWTGEMTSFVPQLDAICFGSLCQRNEITRETVKKCLAATKPECLRVFDINIRQSFYSTEIINSSLEASNVLKLNDEELPIVAAMLGVSGSNEELLGVIIEKYELELAILTCGPEGALMMTSGESNCAVPPRGSVVSTVGAGDSFAAATVMGFLKGRSLVDINKHANELAAYVCTQHGAVPVLPAELIK
ncbi:MAG: carbohydrate kinase [Kiritimatiellia bacterium]|jgi:fructokinase|nr:carbohydrate kinase [Kiritimatiellia bacterium]